MKKKIFDNEEYVTDAGKIISMSIPELDDYSGYAEIVTEDGEFEILGKPSFVILCGQVLLEKEDFIDSLRCCDPRVICMYLWNLRRYFHGLPDEVPPVPTMEEAPKWLKDADIPLEPLERPRDIGDRMFSPQTEKFLFNNKR